MVALGPFEYRVGVTDPQWLAYFRNHPERTEMNFWRPGVPNTRVTPGTPWLFLVEDSLVGCAQVEASCPLPLFKAWEYFESANGFETREEFYSVVASHRRAPTNPTSEIGCIGLTSAVFFEQPIRFAPFQGNWGRPRQQPTKIFSLSTAEGLALWNEVEERLKLSVRFSASGESIPMLPEVRRSVLVRLGQGGFRTRVTEIYEARCAVSGERSLPALDAAHIKPFSLVKAHELTNGLLLRADIHKLFDSGYVSISQDRKFRVSPALRDDYENGRIYYAFEGTELRNPVNAVDRPDEHYLDWHYSTIFKR